MATMPERDLSSVPSTFEVLGRVLPDARVQREALPRRAPHERLVDEPREHVEQRTGARGDGLDVLERELSGEDGALCEDGLLGRREKLPRPVDRRSEGRVPARPRRGPVVQEVEPRLEPSEQGSRVEHSAARSGQLDRERDAVERSNQRERVASRCPARCACALLVEGQGVLVRERGQVDDRLTGHPQPRLRRDDEERLCRDSAPLGDDRARGAREVLEIVEDEEDRSRPREGVADPLDGRGGVELGARGYTEGPHHRGAEIGDLARLGQAAEPDASGAPVFVSVSLAEALCESRLAHPRRTEEGNQAIAS